MLSVTVCALMLIDPRNLLDRGFWLSAGAVAVILAGRFVSGQDRGRVYKAVGLQLLLSVVMLIPGALWFDGVSLIATVESYRDTFVWFRCGPDSTCGPRSQPPGVE